MPVNLLIFSENPVFLSLLKEHEELLSKGLKSLFVSNEDDFRGFSEGADYVLIDQTVSLAVLENVGRNMKIGLIGDRKPAAKEVDVFYETPIRLGEVLDGLLNFDKSRNLISEAPDEIFLAGNISFKPKSLCCEDAKGNAVTITEKEAQFLLSLYNAENHLQDRKTLLHDVWEYVDGVETHTLETHVYRLRQKLGKLQGARDLVETVENGYRLVLAD